MPFRNRRNRWPGRAALLLGGLLLADLALFALLPLDLLYPQLAEDREPVAVAAVLFNGFSSDRSDINGETRRRLHHGLSLLKNNRADLLLVAGGNRPGRESNGARLMAAYLRSQGVAAARIIVEDQSRDTLSNLERISAKLRELGLGSAVLVSSSHHLLRIKASKTPAVMNFRFDPYPAAACDPPLTRTEIWTSAHTNLAAWLAAALLPAPLYDRIVLWVRTHTSF